MNGVGTKVFNDPVHGHIALHPVLVKIIDTPEFQRLREIKQLGATYFVYSGASHNRFEHSIGVCHLVGELIKAIKQNERIRIKIVKKRNQEIKKRNEAILRARNLRRIQDPNGVKENPEDGERQNDDDKKEGNEEKENHVEVVYNREKDIQEEEDIDGEEVEEEEKEEDREEAEQWATITGDEELQKIQNEKNKLNITNTDVLCVMIAGLCHDLGHGIMSHLFESFIKEMEKPEHSTNQAEEYYRNKKLKQRSVLMFDYLIEKNKLKKYLEEEGRIKENDLEFIREQIRGPNNQGAYMVERKGKEFLYKIVADRRNGVDVDKWDYLLRDCQQLGMKCSIDLTRFLQYAKVIEVDKEQQICLRDKQVPDVYIMMQTRKMLHDRAYRHRVANVITVMVIDALKKANNCLVFKGRNVGPNGVTEIEECNMVEACKNMEAFVQLTDNVIFSKILHWEPDTDTPSAVFRDMSFAKKMVERVLKRKFYHFIDSGIFSDSGKGKYTENDEENVKRDILNCCCNNKDDMVVTDDFVVVIINSDYGMGKDDPVQNMRFYSKEEPDKGKKVLKRRVSGTLADCFSDQIIAIYSRRDEKRIKDRLRHLFQEWCKKNRYISKKTNNGNGHITGNGERAAAAEGANTGDGPG